MGVADERRRLKETIEAVASLDGRFTLDLLLVRDNDHRRRLEQLAATNPRIRVLRAVPPNEITTFANGYDVGVHLLPARQPNQITGATRPTGSPSIPPTCVGHTRATTNRVRLDRAATLDGTASITASSRGCTTRRGGRLARPRVVRRRPARRRPDPAREWQGIHACGELRHCSLPGRPGWRSSRLHCRGPIRAEARQVAPAGARRSRVGDAYIEAGGRRVTQGARRGRGSRGGRNHYSFRCRARRSFKLLVDAAGEPAQLSEVAPVG